MLTWFPPVNEIKVQTWRRETVQTSSGGGALVKTALKLLVFLVVNTELLFECPRSRSVTLEEKTLDRTSARRESALK